MLETAQDAPARADYQPLFMAPQPIRVEYDSDDASLIRVTRRDWEKQRRVPAELRAEMLRAGGAMMNFPVSVWLTSRVNASRSMR